jgi:hypothetical protein
VTKKAKELWMGKGELQCYIRCLLTARKYRCALTNIMLKSHSDRSDHQLWPSLDRIDSNGDYTEDNCQVVCKFVNQ